MNWLKVENIWLVLLITLCAPTIKGMTGLIQAPRAQATGPFLFIQKRQLNDLKNYLAQNNDITITDTKGRSLLFFASQLGYVDAVILLVDYGATIDTPDKTNSTPLQAAIESGNTDIATYLIHKGSLVTHQNSAGNTPLHAAASKGFMNIANTLIERGANINKQNSAGMTPLHTAVIPDNFDMIALLLLKGANPNIMNIAGLSPLMIATQNKKYDAIKLLLKYSADPNLTNNNNKRAADFTNDTSIKEMLNNPKNLYLSENELKKLTTVKQKITKPLPIFFKPKIYQFDAVIYSEDKKP